MDILLHLDNETTAVLDHIARERGQPCDALAMEALKNWLAAYRVQQWPTEVLNFQGVPDYAAV